MVRNGLVYEYGVRVYPRGWLCKLQYNRCYYVRSSCTASTRTPRALTVVQSRQSNTLLDA